MFEQIKAVPNTETQHRLLIELLALLTDERIIKMVENLIEQEEWILDTPFLRRIRSQVEEALRKGLEKGKREERRQSILELLLLRYDPSAKDYLDVQDTLSSIWSSEILTDIFKITASADDFATFSRTLEKMTNNDTIGQPQSA